MFMSHKLATAFLLLGIGTVGLAQTEDAPAVEDSEQLEMAAVEALMFAPPEKALTIVAKVLKGEGSEELKERALFVLSQIERPEAQNLLVETARSADGPLSNEAIRMIGIGGGPEALSALPELYAGGDRERKEAVLEAYLIADDEEAVYRIAANAQDAEEFEADRKSVV